MTPEEVDCVWVQCQLGVPPDRAIVRRAWDAAYRLYYFEANTYEQYRVYARVFNQTFYGACDDAA
jgi:hypothetical protein